MPAFRLKASLQSIAARHGYQIERRYELGEYRLDVLQLLVERSDPKDPNFFFIQIGANDGESNDQINGMVRDYHWRGLLLEPQPAVFADLVRNYAGFDRLIFENAALSTRDGTARLYTVGNQTGFGSFDRNVLYRQGLSDLQIESIDVATVSVEFLVAKYGIGRVDLLQIDTEGFDFEVIKMFLSGGLRPRIINYEHLHLSNRDRNACIGLLGGLGYKMLQAGPERIDTVAYRA